MAKLQENPGGGIMDSFVEGALDEALNTLFSPKAGPCREGKELLRSFAESRPEDFDFLQASDVGSGTNSAFAGIPEWDAFAEHFASCRSCHA